MKLLKKSVLLYLGLKQEFLDLDAGEYVGYEYLYDRLGWYSQSSIREAVADLYKKDMLEKYWQGRRVRFKLTSVGRRALESLWPNVFAKKRQGIKKYWLIVLKPTSDFKRRWLKEIIQESGFKRIARGTWLGFSPITEKNRREISQKGLLGRIIMVEVKNFAWTDPKQLLIQASGAKNAQKEAKQIISKAKQLLRGLKNQKGLSNQSKKTFSRLNKSLVELLDQWPYLNRELDELKNTTKELFLSFQKLNKAWRRLKSD